MIKYVLTTEPTRNFTATKLENYSGDNLAFMKPERIHRYRTVTESVWVNQYDTFSKIVYSDDGEVIKYYNCDYTSLIEYFGKLWGYTSETSTSNSYTNNYLMINGAYINRASNTSYNPFVMNDEYLYVIFKHNYERKTSGSSTTQRWISFCSINMKEKKVETFMPMVGSLSDTYTAGKIGKYINGLGTRVKIENQTELLDVPLSKFVCRCGLFWYYDADTNTLKNVGSSTLDLPLTFKPYIYVSDNYVYLKYMGKYIIMSDEDQTNLYAIDMDKLTIKNIYSGTFDFIYNVWPMREKVITEQIALHSTGANEQHFYWDSLLSVPSLYTVFNYLSSKNEYQIYTHCNVKPMIQFGHNKLIYSKNFVTRSVPIDNDRYFDLSYVRELIGADDDFAGSAYIDDKKVSSIYVPNQYLPYTPTQHKLSISNLDSVGTDWNIYFWDGYDGLWQVE